MREDWHEEVGEYGGVADVLLGLGAYLLKDFCDLGVVEWWVGLLEKAHKERYHILWLRNQFLYDYFWLSTLNHLKELVIFVSPLHERALEN